MTTAIATIPHLRWTVLACALLAACSPGREDSAAAPPAEETAFDDMVGTMDKARVVEDTTRQHKQALDRALEQDEGVGEQ